MRRTMTAILALLIGAGCGGNAGSMMTGDGSELLGTAQTPGYHLDPNVPVALDAAGFAVTADGNGAYRIEWRGESNDLLEGVLTTEGTFDPSHTSVLSGKELVANTPERIQFSVTGSGSAHALAFTSTAGPVTLALTFNSALAASSIHFPRAGKVQVSGYDPVAFTSP